METTMSAIQEREFDGKGEMSQELSRSDSLFTQSPLNFAKHES